MEQGQNCNTELPIIALVMESLEIHSWKQHRVM